VPVRGHPQCGNSVSAIDPGPRTATKLGLVGQFFEQPVPVSNVPCLLAFQLPKKRLCYGRVLPGALQRSDHLKLMGDVSFITVKKAFGFLKKLLQGRAVHAAAYQPNRRQGRFSAVESFSPSAASQDSRAANTLQ
jgi:hypothetical protein